MSPAVTHNELLGHLVRAEPLAQHGRSSYQLAAEVLDAADFDSAADYGALTVQEASEAYALYALWLRQIPEVLTTRGVDGDTVDCAMREITATIGDHDLDSGWAAYRDLIADFGAACRDADAGAARRLLSEARATWQHHHDRAYDTVSALFDFAATTLGESFIGELWDVLLAGMYERAAKVYDPSVSPWTRSVERLLLDIFEATRGHLAGPRRDGAFTVEEEQDRWVIKFAPCGSGGRSYATSHSMTTEEHDWAWNATGVCLYCAHCCQLQQRAPIARLGFPLRVVEPPRQGQNPSVCTWSIYKDPALVPDEAYTSVGFDPPTR